MVSFVGEYERQLDERGRFILPARIREKLSGTVYIIKALLEPCLNLYTEDEWLRISQEAHELPTGTDPIAAEFTRKLFSRTLVCEIDKQGRIALNEKLIKKAGLKKDIILAGANSKLEIWDADLWNSKDDDDDEDDIALIVQGVKDYKLHI